MVREAVEFQVDIFVEPDEGGFHAYCPALKGLHVGGDTEEEALQNAKDAVVLYLQSMLKHGEPIPLTTIVGKEPPAEERHPRGVHAHTERLSLSLT